MPLFRTVLVAADFSESSSEAFRTACSLAHEDKPAAERLEGLGAAGETPTSPDSWYKPGAGDDRTIEWSRVDGPTLGGLELADPRTQLLYLIKEWRLRSGPPPFRPMHWRRSRSRWWPCLSRWRSPRRREFRRSSAWSRRSSAASSCRWRRRPGSTYPGRPQPDLLGCEIVSRIVMADARPLTPGARARHRAWPRRSCGRHAAQCWSYARPNT